MVVMMMVVVVMMSFSMLENSHKVRCYYFPATVRMLRLREPKAT